MDDEELASQRRDGTIVKAIVIRCHASKAIFSWAVPCKGDDEDGYVVRLIVKAVAWLGHCKLILKADNEPAIQALVKSALKAMRVEVEGLEGASSEAPQPYDSQANGSVESGIRNLRKDFRTLRLCLESRLGWKIPINHPVFAWLLPHVAFFSNNTREGRRRQHSLAASPRPAVCR